ncbi:hypothetical protein C5O22_03575 [Treponema sp. J25]|nr:hypothetical protein C5O22_03575 [Treponema sp. J25]
MASFVMVPFDLKAQQVIENDTEIPVNEDLSVIPSAKEQGDSSLKSGLWIEVTSNTVSLIRDIATGTKSGYELDRASLFSKANWWFWGEVIPGIHLDAEIGLWKLDHTLYQANSYGANVPDVTWGDGIQGIASLFFAPVSGLNSSTPGVLNKLGFSIKGPHVESRIGYGSLNENTMSGFTGIYNVLDPWDDVGKGFWEFRNGKALQSLGENSSLNVLVALSRMRGEYGLYSVTDLRLGEDVQLAATFTSVSNSTELFRYNEQNLNALSNYGDFRLNETIGIELHVLTTFGTEVPASLDASAVAGRVRFSKGAYTTSVAQSFAGKKADTVWGNNAILDADTATTTWIQTLTLGQSLSFTLDSSLTLAGMDDLTKGQWTGRFQPIVDVSLVPFFSLDLSLSAYGVFLVDRLAENTASDRPWVFRFSEGGIEIKALELSPYVKKILFDYALLAEYGTWSSSRYPLNVLYHSVMTTYDVDDSLGFTGAALFRQKLSEDPAWVPFGFALGFSQKTSITSLGSPRLWAHITYGMDPYESTGYELYRADDPDNRPEHRTFLLNSLYEAVTESRISIGLIWDLK